jgi:hypothetical protein
MCPLRKGKFAIQAHVGIPLDCQHGKGSELGTIATVLGGHLSVLSRLRVLGFALCLCFPLCLCVSVVN